MSVVADKALFERAVEIMSDRDRVFFAPLEMAPRLIPKRFPNTQVPETPLVFIDRQSMEYAPYLSTINRFGPRHGFYVFVRDTSTDTLRYFHVVGLAKRVDYRLSIVADKFALMDQLMNRVGYSILMDPVNVPDIYEYRLWPITSNFEVNTELQMETLANPLNVGSFIFTVYVWVFEMKETDPPVVSVVNVSYELSPLTLEVRNYLAQAGYGGDIFEADLSSLGFTKGTKS